MQDKQIVAELQRQLAEARATAAELTAKIQALAAQRRTQAARERQLAAIVEASRDAIWSWDTDCIITSWNNEAERLLQYSADEIVGRSLLTLVPEERHRGARAAIAKLRDGGWIGQFETVRLRKDGTPVEVELTVSPIRDPDGGVTAVATVCRDITERQRAQERQQLLLNELDHRVKNTLATVLALMHQTRRSSADLDEFLAAFEARLRTLVRTHESLLKNDYTGARLKELIEAELDAFRPESKQAVQMDGDAIMLNWRSAQMICLAVHELAANAARHGSLSVERGRVCLEWKLSLRDEPQVRLEWREENGPRIESVPSRSGFGRTLLERGLPAALGGSSSLEFSPLGVTYRLLFSAEDHLVVPTKEEASGG